VTSDSGCAFIAIGEAKLEYRLIGPSPEEAPTIVLLHEGLGSVSSWRDFPARLQEATGMGVFSYSRPGYGRSSSTPLPRPADYLHREALEVLPRALDAVGVREAVLFGHSDGASIATIYAGAKNDPRVRALALLAPHFMVEPVSIAGIEEARIAYEQHGLRGRLARHHAHVDVAFYGWNDTWLREDFAALDLRAFVRNISAPVFMAQGEDDRYGTLAQLDVLNEHCRAPVESLILAGCGHAPHREKADELLGGFTSFLDRRLGRR